MRLENLILANAVRSENFARRVLPFLKPEYFTDAQDKTVHDTLQIYIDKYNHQPSFDALLVELDARKDMDEDGYKKCVAYVNELKEIEGTDENWLVDKTESFCQNKAIYLAISKAIKIADGQEKELGKGSIPKLLTDALAVSFDNSVGHDFLEDAEKRYESYHEVEDRIPFDLQYMNDITRGGLPKKTINVIMGGTGGGKTLFMCHMAAANLLKGYNVLYITLEMSEKSISERIDANLLDIDLDELIDVSRETYIKKIDKVKSKTTGRLKIKEYPTAGASAANFRHLLNELRLKQNFVPDIIYVDYLNICCSSRIKLGNTVNSYTFVKTIAEELRGLAQEFNVPLVTATQVNRTGFKSSDPDLADTSESFGLPATSDFFVVLTSTDELNELNQIMVKQLKNRYTDVTKKRKFVVGINRARMKLFDVSEEEQTLNDDAPVMDKTSFGQQDSERSKKTKKFTEFT